MAIVFAALPSCTKNIEDISDVHTYQISCSTDDVKACLGEMIGGTNHRGYVWQKGDVLHVGQIAGVKDVTEADFVLKSGAGTSNGIFEYTGEKTFDNTSWKGIIYGAKRIGHDSYFNNGFADNRVWMQYSIPNTQEYVANNIKPEYAPVYALGVTDLSNTRDGSGNTVFRHICGIIRIPLHTDSPYTTVKSIELTCTKNIAGNFRFQYYEGAIKYMEGADGNVYQSITYNMPNVKPSATEGNTVYANIVVNASYWNPTTTTTTEYYTTLDGLTVNVKYTLDDEKPDDVGTITKRRTNKALRITPNMIITIPAIELP